MKILLAIDGSPASKAAVLEVARRLWPPGSEVRVITVDPSLDANLLRGSPHVYEELARQQRTEVLGHLEEAETLLREHLPSLLVVPVLREGWPQDVLLEEAERWGADLIVVGSNGSDPIRRFFLGSVSLALATNAPCSVEIVRAPRTDATEPAG